MKIRTSLFGSTLIYSISNILNGALPFILLPIMTHLLPPREYGVLAMFTVMQGIMSAFTGLSVHGAVNSRYVDRGEIDFPNYVGASLWVLGISTLATTLFVTLLQDPLSKLASISPFWVFMSIAVSSANFIVQIRLGIWLMARKSIEYGILQVSLSLINVGLSLGLVYWVSRNAEGRMWGQTIAIVIFGVVAVVSLVRGGWVNMHLNRQYIREIFAFGLPLIPHVLGTFLLAFADRWIVNERLGLQAAGVYLVAAQLGIGMGMVADAFNKAYVPRLYEKLKIGTAADIRVIVRGTWVYFGLLLTLAGFVAVLAPWIIELCAGTAYRKATEAFRWIAFGQAFGGMYVMVANYIFYKRKTNLIGWFTLISGLVGIIFAWLLVPIMGVAGAGAGFSLGALIKFLLTWRLANNVYPLPWFRWSVVTKSNRQMNL